MHNLESQIQVCCVKKFCTSLDQKKKKFPTPKLISILIPGSLYYAFLYTSFWAVMDAIFIRMPTPHTKLQTETSVQLDIHLPSGFNDRCSLRTMVSLYFSWDSNPPKQNHPMDVKTQPTMGSQFCQRLVSSGFPLNGPKNPPPSFEYASSMYPSPTQLGRCYSIHEKNSP